MIFSYRKMVYTPLHGKKHLEDSSLLFLLYILTPTQVILLRVNITDQILLLTQAPFSMTQAMVTTGKLDVFLTHLEYVRQILKRMVKIKTLRQQQTEVIMTAPNKHRSQTRTLELPMKLLQHPISRQSGPLSISGINNPTIENSLQNGPDHSRGGKNHLRPNHTPRYSETNRY